MNTSIHSGLPISESNKMVMYQVWHDYLQPKYGEKKLCCINRDSFIAYIKTEGIYVETVKYFKGRFYTSNYKLGKLVAKGNK